MPTDNQRQAQRISAIIASYPTDDSAAACVTDLLADVRHWCDQNGEDFAKLDSDAYLLYLTEREDEGRRS